MNIGLIAGDSRKKLMQNFCIAYRGILSRHQLYATGTTGRMVAEATGLSVHKYMDGILGGAEQFANQVSQNGLDLVIFLNNQDEISAKQLDSRNVFMLCDQYNIPLATNLATAELLIHSLEKGDLEWREAYHV